MPIQNWQKMSPITHIQDRCRCDAFFGWWSRGWKSKRMYVVKDVLSYNQLAHRPMTIWWKSGNGRCLRRASAGRITAVMPYFGYAHVKTVVPAQRVCPSQQSGTLISPILWALTAVTVDLHSDQIQGFFDIPVDNIYGTLVLFKDLWAKNNDNLMVVSPDVGGVVRARATVSKQAVGDADNGNYR